MRSGLRILFLQGPHGPFFGQLAGHLHAAGHAVQRIGFNRGDEAGWPDRKTYVPFTGSADEWRPFLQNIVTENSITDIVLYGDSRPVHAMARELAQESGVRLHCFEEGYLRPFWVTYERGGSNGNSPVMAMSVAEIRAQAISAEPELRAAPVQWGAIWHHSWYGCLYHANILFRNGNYRFYRSHRTTGVAREWWLHFNRLVMMPAHLLQRKIATSRLLRSGRIYHLALLQLGHDSAVTGHSEFSSMQDFMETCAQAFSQAASPDEVLVFKAHPLEDGREKLASITRRLERDFDLKGRVTFLYGGNLGPLLDAAKSVVTINSTAGQQALWRGLPLKIFGRAVYGKPEFVSAQSLPDFFRDPMPPDALAYRDFRTFLLNTSQLGGGYYTASGRAGLLRRIIPMILAEADPYAQLSRPDADTANVTRLDQFKSGKP